MKHLRELQLRFQDYLVSGAEDIEQDIISTEAALAEHRLGTYYNAYRIRLIDCLAVDYAALEKYLGREAFENIALDYLQNYPSTHPSSPYPTPCTPSLYTLTLYFSSSYYFSPYYTLFYQQLLLIWANPVNRCPVARFGDNQR